MSHIHIMSLLKILKSHSKKLRRVTSPPYPTGAGRGGVGRGGSLSVGPCLLSSPQKKHLTQHPLGKPACDSKRCLSNDDYNPSHTISPPESLRGAGSQKDRTFLSPGIN